VRRTNKYPAATNLPRNAALQEKQRIREGFEKPNRNSIPKKKEEGK
jgi:hypothetical protein